MREAVLSWECLLNDLYEVLGGQFGKFVINRNIKLFLPGTPPLKKAIPQLQGPLFSQKPHSERTPTDLEYDVG